MAEGADGKDAMIEWRIGRKVALNVYDGDRPVCQCHTVKDAELIAKAVNLYKKWQTREKQSATQTERTK